MTNTIVFTLQVDHAMPNLVPRASFPLTSGRKTRALGASIFELTKEPNSGYPDHCAVSVCIYGMLWRMPEMDALRALVFRPLVKGKEALGTRLRHARSDIHEFICFCEYLLWVTKAN